MFFLTIISSMELPAVLDSNKRVLLRVRDNSIHEPTTPLRELTKVV